MILVCKMTTSNMMLENVWMNNNMQYGSNFIILLQLHNFSKQLLLSYVSIYDAFTKIKTLLENATMNTTLLSTK